VSAHAASDTDVVVVGAGVFGASVANSLSARGRDVILIDRAEPGDAGSPSGAPGRISRCAHGADALLADLARRARHRWLELQSDAGEQLFTECGAVTMIGERDQRWALATVTVLERLGVPVRQLGRKATAALFPSFRGDGLSGAVLEPTAGVLRGGRAVRALAARAQSRGVTLVRADARPVAPGDVAAGSERIVGRHVIWACGAGLAAALPSAVSFETRYQDVVHLNAPPAWDVTEVPAWIDRSAPAYGHGSIDAGGVKVVPDIDRASPTASPGAALQLAREYAALRFPELVEMGAADYSVCHYNVTVDEQFIVDRIPGDPRGIIVGGDSGQGFKHGPAIGEHVADIVEGRQQPLPRFAIDRRRPDAEAVGIAECLGESA